MLKELIILIRPKQWVKNLFVLVPLIFSKAFVNSDSVIKALAVTLCFIAVSSSVYILNDIIDYKRDRLHEKKRTRPIASGRMEKRNAAGFMLVFMAVGLIAAYFIHPYVVLCLVAYVVLNILYSLVLKKIAVLDIMIIAIGFVLRVISGAVGIQVYISSWVLLCAFFISLCIGAGKRKSEKAALMENSTLHRKALKNYTDQFLNGVIEISVTGTAITYSLYTILEYETQLPMITILFVFFGLLRYMQLISEEKEGRLPEEIILSDKPLLFSIFLFGAAWIIIFLTI
ncbi:MAG TPA: decaprenyl-phosphate phosphoribosyltransferase [Clostridia bacterium]